MWLWLAVAMAVESDNWARTEAGSGARAGKHNNALWPAVVSAGIGV